MSEIKASDRVTCDPQPEPQGSITGMSPGKETPEGNSKDRFLEKTESQTDIAEISEQGPPTSAREKSDDQGPPTSAREKSHDQGPPTSAREKSDDQGPLTSAREKSDDQGPATSAREKSDDQGPPTSAREKSDDQGPPTSAREKSDDQGPPTSAREKSDDQGPPTSSREKSDDQGPPTSAREKSDDQGPTTSITEQSDGQEPPTSITEQSDDQDSPIGTTYKSSGQEPPTSTTHNSDEQKSPIGTIDMASGQEPPTSTTHNSNEQKSPIGTIDMASGQVPPATIVASEPKSQAGTAENSEQEAPTTITGKFVEKELPKSTGDGSGYQKPHRSTTDHSSEYRDITTESITKKQLDPPLYPRQRQVFREGAASQPPPQSETVIEEKPTTSYHWLIGPVVSAVVVVGLYFVFSRKGQPPVHEDPVLQTFFKEFARLKKDFPGQNEGLWFRSEKLLRKHLNTSHPSAPSILLLTAARDGEQTLRCVSQRLAKSYADSLSATFLMVHGPSHSEFDSDTSKMQIDEELSSGFQSGSRAAVLYRLETLPPGSLIIFYKYCDHENAAFKKVALVLTILLDEQSLETDLSFTEVEEKVKDFVWERFAYPGVSAHNEMDVDKLGAVWSRISHVVLPVLPVGSIESGSCPGV